MRIRPDLPAAPQFLDRADGCPCVELAGKPLLGELRAQRDTSLLSFFSSANLALRRLSVSELFEPCCAILSNLSALLAVSLAAASR